MQIFALYFRIDLSQKPKWFDDFYEKYEGVNDLHLTVIQPRYIDEARMDALKQTLAIFLDTHTLTEEEKILDFNKLVYGPEADGTYLFMLLAPLEKQLSDFQKELRKVVGHFGSYVEKVTEEYEVDFKPHITIGRNIAEGTVEGARSYFDAEYRIVGTVTELVMPIVNDSSIEEAANPKNLTVFDV